jgi:hypothetical protein
MADACMPEKFYQSARPMLPAEREIGPHGGRPPKSHHVVLKVIWFVLVTGQGRRTLKRCSGDDLRC